MSTLGPNAKEIRALRLFVSEDITREHLCRLWMYGSDGGLTYMGTDGHTMVVRRSGTHRKLSPFDVSKFEPYEANEQGLVCATQIKPPAWHQLLQPGSLGKLAPTYGFSPEYIARVGDVERAVGARASDDFTPRPGMSVKDAKKMRTGLKTSGFATWIVPSDPLDGWYWKITADAALWEGVVMPRRV